jgi:hypothetical protein
MATRNYIDGVKLQQTYTTNGVKKCLFIGCRGTPVKSLFDNGQSARGLE